ncbi:MAG: hypothetical protein HQ553_17345 [Chloroflexi bacterium]|nr:hypothetical protein [Chloroflexota bacterium]
MVTKLVIFILILMMVIAAGCVPVVVPPPANVVTMIVEDSDGNRISPVYITITLPDGTETTRTTTNGRATFSPTDADKGKTFTIDPEHSSYTFSPDPYELTWFGIPTTVNFEATRIPVAPTWYRDSDNDTYGDPGTTLETDTQPTGYVGNSNDCNDSDASVNPGATELCGDGIDQDCNGSDLTCTLQTWYLDSDGDGYGGLSTRIADTQPTGYVADSGDCDDSVCCGAGINPGATEICGDGIDQDCSGSDLNCPLNLFTITVKTSTGLPVDGVTVTIDTPYGDVERETGSDGEATYSPSLLYSGRSYTITPTKSGYSFNPPSKTVIWSVGYHFYIGFEAVDIESDTDNDGAPDYVENIAGTDPTDPLETPKPKTIYEYDELGRILKITRIK